MASDHGGPDVEGSHHLAHLVEAEALGSLADDNLCGIGLTLDTASMQSERNRNQAKFMPSWSEVP